MANTIYHNERCSKSRGAIDLLRERGVAAEVVDYVATPPTIADLERLGRLLGLPPLAMMRTGDPLFTQLGLATTDQRTDQEWFAHIVANPLLLQRPIVVIGNRAIIARPSELVLQLLP